jgi:hypothetical protein
MFKRKKKDKKVEVTHIPLPILIRQVIYDSMLEPSEGIAEIMGLPPISDEVAEMEVEDSQKRLERFSKLLPFIDSHSDMASRICAAAYAIEDEEDSLSSLGDVDIDNVTSLFKVVAISSTISCISTLFNLGLIESKVESNGE